MSRQKQAENSSVSVSAGPEAPQAEDGIEPKVTLGRAVSVGRERKQSSGARVRITDAFAHRLEGYFEEHGRQLDKPLEVRDSVVGGLILRREPTGHKKWHFEFWLDGHRGRVKVGNFPAIGVEIARRVARMRAGEVAMGIDPAAQKRKRKRRARLALERRRQKRLEGA